MHGFVSYFRVMILGMFVLLFVFSSPAIARYRGDVLTKAAVESVIERDGRLDLDDLKISCHDGIIKLRGTVLSGDEKGLATELAMEVSAVRGIENDLQVVPILSDDLKVEKEAESTLLANPLLHIRDLRIRSRHGIVTVRGLVYHRSEKRFVTELLSDLPDVKRVINKIEVL